MTEQATEQKTEQASPFISETDTFNISVDYYRDGKKVVAEGSEGFDAKRDKSNVVFTIRYPSQADCEAIMNTSKSFNADVESDKMDIRKYMRAELVRLLTLVKGWNMKETISNESVMNLHPDIIRAALVKIRTELGTNGIF